MSNKYRITLESDIQGGWNITLRDPDSGYHYSAYGRTMQNAWANLGASIEANHQIYLNAVERRKATFADMVAHIAEMRQQLPGETAVETEKEFTQGEPHMETYGGFVVRDARVRVEDALRRDLDDPGLDLPR